MTNYFLDTNLIVVVILDRRLIEEISNTVSNLAAFGGNGEAFGSIDDKGD
jgi:hypothetical protein